MRNTATAFSASPAKGFVQDFQIVSFDPNSCRLVVTVTQSTQFADGTGIFAGATGTGTGRVDGRGLGQRNRDGSCSMDLPPKHERDAVSGSGTLMTRPLNPDASWVPAARAGRCPRRPPGRPWKPARCPPRRGPAR